MNFILFTVPVFPEQKNKKTKWQTDQPNRSKIKENAGTKWGGRYLLVFEHEAALDGVHAGVGSVGHGGDVKREG